jgi:cytoskeletal protein CcmA (bactofilin family)
MDETNGTRVDSSSRIVGELQSGADVRIDGLFEGTIRTAGSLTIGDVGEVKGDLFGADIIVDGKVTGDVHAAGHLSIGPAGVLIGDITAGGLSIADGSTFRGKVEMSRDHGGDISQEVAPTGDPLGVDQEFDPTLITEALDVPVAASLDSEDDEPPLWDTDEHRAAESRALMESAYTVPVGKGIVATPDDLEPPPRRSIDQLGIPKK